MIEPLIIFVFSVASAAAGLALGWIMWRREVKRLVKQVEDLRQQLWELKLPKRPFLRNWRVNEKDPIEPKFTAVSFDWSSSKARPIDDLLETKKGLQHGKDD